MSIAEQYPNHILFLPKVWKKAMYIPHDDNANYRASDMPVGISLGSSSFYHMLQLCSVSTCLRSRFPFFYRLWRGKLFSHSVVCDSLQPHGLQHTRLPCHSLFPRVCSNWCPLSWWCHPTISSSVTLFSSCPQSFPVSGSFPMSWLFTSGGQNIGASPSASIWRGNCFL